MEKIVLELTNDEVIMLQELSSGVECGSEWQDRIAASLNRKAMEAYRKPKLSKEEYEHHMNRIMQDYCPELPREAVVQQEHREMVAAALRFYYRIGGDEE